MINYKTIIEQHKTEIEKFLEFFKQELRKVRTGKASPALVEDILVSYYGQMMSIKQVAAISCPEPRQIFIQPWDKSMLSIIDKAISQANIGATPSVDGNGIRINLPSLTEEFRKTLVVQIGKEKENAREEVRKWRDTVLKEIQTHFQNKEVSEDDKFKAKDEMQKLADGYNTKIDEAIIIKTREITEI